MGILTAHMYFVEGIKESTAAAFFFLKRLQFFFFFFVSRVLEKDQFHKLCIPLYVSTLVHLNKVTRKKHPSLTEKLGKENYFQLAYFFILKNCLK